MVSWSANRLKLSTLLPLAASPPHTKSRSVFFSTTPKPGTQDLQKTSLSSPTRVVVLDSAGRLSLEVNLTQDVCRISMCIFVCVCVCVWSKPAN